MKMRIKIWQHGRPKRVPAPDEIIDVENNAHLAGTLARVIDNYSKLHGDMSLLDDDVNIQIDRVKADANRT